MELKGELARPDLVGLIPSNDITGISQSYTILPQPYYRVTIRDMDHALETQPPLSAVDVACALVRAVRTNGQAEALSGSSGVHRRQDSIE